MIVNSSALPAVPGREPDAARYQAAIPAAVPCRMSVASVLETSIVIESRGGVAAGAELDAFLERAGIEPAPVTAEQLGAARQAWRRFGKGRYPAALNFGDGFAHAPARAKEEPLRCNCDGFALIDISPAVPPAGSGVGHGPDLGHRGGAAAPRRPLLHLRWR